MTKKPNSKDSAVEKVEKSSPSNVTLPPIDATPEEIAHALFQRPPLKKPKAKESGES